MGRNSRRKQERGTGIIHQQWLSFAKAVLPDNAPPVQITEMRRAFYAGVITMLKTAKNLGDNNISEDEGVIILEAIEQECKEFQKQVEKGQA